MAFSKFFQALSKHREENPRRGVDFYESLYAEYLSGAFIDNVPQRKFLIYATQLYHEKRFNNALTVLKRLWNRCQTPADYRSVLFFTALSYSRMGDRHSAIAAYQELLKHDPRDSTAWSNLGEQFRREGFYKDAIHSFEEAIRSDGQNAMAHSNLAVVYVRIGAYEEAIPYGKRALELNPTLYYAATSLAMAFYALGDREQCEHYSRQALINGENEADLKLALSKIHAVDLGGPGIPEELEPVMAEWARRTSIPVALMGIGGMEKGKGRHQIGGPSLGPAPLDSHGKPMRLLCAIRCDELQCLPDFPDKGLLRFYIADNTDFGVNRADPTEQSDFRVLYTHTEEGLERQPEPAHSDTFPVAWECRGLCYPHTDAMPMEDYRFAEKFNALLKEYEQPPLEELPEYVVRSIGRRFRTEGHRLGGYPWFTQSDPRKDPRYAKYDMLLLQVDNHVIKEQPDVDIRFGRSGVCNFFIPREKLRARDFSDILYWWDEEAESKTTD